MILPVNLRIMKVQLAARKRQTVVAMLGVTFGIGMFILMMSFMKGMNDFFEDILLSVTPVVHIYNDYKTDYSSSVVKQFYGQDQKTGSLFAIRAPPRSTWDSKTLQALLKISGKIIKYR